MVNVNMYECPRCQIGHCHRNKTTYTRLHNGRLISVQDMTVYNCDVCGFQEFDPDSMIILQRLLGYNGASMGDDARRVAKSPQVDAAEVAKTQRPKP